MCPGPLCRPKWGFEEGVVRRPRERMKEEETSSPQGGGKYGQLGEYGEKGQLRRWATLMVLLAGHTRRKRPTSAVVEYKRGLPYFGKPDSQGG